MLTISLNVKQEAHGPHCSPEKQFKSINTYAHNFDYSITIFDYEKQKMFSETQIAPDNGQSKYCQGTVTRYGTNTLISV